MTLLLLRAILLRKQTFLLFTTTLSPLVSLGLFTDQKGRLL